MEQEAMWQLFWQTGLPECYTIYGQLAERKQGEEIGAGHGEKSA